ncbi:MAG TPA: alpha/beta fold hydrolase [Ramlibacter sp.]|nr:alpha/beta fold hydrolase [Ramlibacter sp.]
MELSHLPVGAHGAAQRTSVRATPRPLAADQPVVEGAVPLVFDAAGSWCFGWYHRATGAPRGVGVVLCRPIGYEAMCSYQTYTRLAELLARAGFDVLRFDYQGTGESAGDDADPYRVRAWMASIQCAAAQLRSLAGVSRLALFGVRLGATLAAHAASEMGDIESLVLWAPCVTGRAFTRELRAASANRAIQPGAANEGDVEALGCLYTAQTLQDLQALDCTRLQQMPAGRVLLIGRDDMPVASNLPQALQSLGVHTTCEALPGYARMMVEPHESAPEFATLDAIAAWLAAAPGLDGASLPRLPVRVRSGELEGGVRESAISFGPENALFGVLAEPAQAGIASETAVLLLNVGGNYRAGPNRLYVRMARSLAAAGMHAFRFDLGGIGDSRSATGPRSRTRDYFSIAAAADVRAAIDFLTTRGCSKFVLVGVCSGSYVAFQAALADDRVTGQVLMNSRLLEWREGDDDAWQASMQQHYKSSAFYWRALLRPEVHRRLWRGEVDVRGIARRLATVAHARLRRAAARLTGHGGQREESVIASTRRLSARGTDTLVVMAAQDDGRDYMEFHFGTGGSRLRNDPHFRMVVVDDSDHTFSTRQSQQNVIGIVQRHLLR